MTLPIINQPTYELTIPSSKEKIRYRPFLVKEEKILLMAQEGTELDEQIEAVKQIIRNCVVSDGFKFEKLSTFDIEYLFINIRSKSVGNILDLNYRFDNCTAELEDGSATPRICQVPFQLNLEDVSVRGQDGHNNIINLTDDVGVVMKYPDFKLLNKIVSMSNYEQLLDVIGGCVQMIFMGEETYDPSEYSDAQLREFFENLSQDQFKKVSHFFETMPQTVSNVNIECKKCGKRQSVEIKGISDFFA